MADARPRVLMGLTFFPRGGSAQVTRSLARALPKAGWDATILSGSIRRPGHPGDAERFFAGLDVRAVDYTPALDAEDPLLADPPLHPSYEDRPGAPDRVFAAVDSHTYSHHVAAWERELAAAGAADADVLHLHHLTPMHEAAARVAPDVPVVGHLHGTELLMLEAIEREPERWPCAEAWVRRMRRWAGRCERLVLLSESQVHRVEPLLGIDPQRCAWIPNGFDPDAFDRRQVDRPAFWHRHLVEEPQGWAPGGEAGSVRYAPEDLTAFAEGPTLLYVGRFTEVKRVGLLVRAYARARERFPTRAPLVLVGGFPGEWEGEHPAEAVAATGARDVFLAGWHDHAELPQFFAASDAIVLPSVREQFGQVLVEGMACGLPAIAVDNHGPAEIVAHGETGWLVEPDDEEGLAEALIQAVSDEAERARRGAAAHHDVRARFTWPALARQLAEVYSEAGARTAPPPVPAGSR